MNNLYLFNLQPRVEYGGGLYGGQDHHLQHTQLGTRINSLHTRTYLDRPALYELVGINPNTSVALMVAA